MLKHLLLTSIIVANSTSISAERDTNTTPTVTATFITVEQMLIRLKSANGITVKLDDKGNILSAESKQWACLHQKSNDLTWEVKTTSGLRDKTNTYTWIQHKLDQSEWLSWFKNRQGKCTGEARCETADYVTKVNQQKLCNFADWRLPTRIELEGLVVMGSSANEAKIDTHNFPNTQASWYWTADINENYPDFAWYVLFKNGVSLSDKKLNPKHVRLVRGNL